MKAKINLPSRDAILAGLEPRAVHPPLARAEDDAGKAERELERRRAELGDRTRAVTEMPPRIQRGEVKASALAEALRERDAAALLVPPAESALARARDRVTTETKLATEALDREFNRRAEILEQAVAEVSPVLAEIRELAAALCSLRGDGACLKLDWPESPMADVGTRIAMRSTGPAPVELAWGKR